MYIDLVIYFVFRSAYFAALTLFPEENGTKSYRYSSSYVVIPILVLITYFVFQHFFSFGVLDLCSETSVSIPDD